MFSLMGPWGKTCKLFSLKMDDFEAFSFLRLEVSSVVCSPHEPRRHTAVAQRNMILIIGSCAIQGMGASGIRNGSYTIIGVVLPPRLRPMVTAILGALFGIICVLGPMLGGAITENISWRWCFYINLPLGGAVAIALLSMKSPKKLARAEMTYTEIILQMDPLGVALIVSATLCILLALHWGGVEKSWKYSCCHRMHHWICIVDDGFHYGPTFHERTSILSLQDFEATQHRSCSGVEFYVYKFNVNFTDFRIGGAFTMHMYFLPLYFQAILGASPTNSGMRVLPLIIAMTIFSIVAATFITTLGMPMYIMLIGAAMACVASGFVHNFDIDTSSSKWIGSLTLLGSGYGFTLQLGLIIGQASSNPEDIAVTTSAVSCTHPELT